MDYDPKLNLQHWPTPMSRFGQLENGDNRYRIVFAPSRRRLVYALDRTGMKHTQWKLKYPMESRRRSWIMEAWMTPFEFCGMTADRYAAEYGTIIDPQGEYDLCHEFETCNPGNANLDKLIQWIEMGKKRRAVENQIAVRDELEREDAATHDFVFESYREKMSAFGNAPVSGYGGGSGTKTREFNVSANQIRLPGKLRGRETAPFQGIFNPKQEVVHAP